MLFSSKPTYLLYISRSRARLFDKQGDQTEALLPTEATQYLEVLDRAKLIAALVKVLSDKNIHDEHIAIVLDDDMVFREMVPLPANSDPAKLRSDLLTKIPFEPNNRIVSELVKDNKLIVFGANRQFISAAVEAAQTAHNKVTAAIPANAYGLRGARELTPKIITTLLGNSTHAERVNFLHDLA